MAFNYLTFFVDSFLNSEWLELVVFFQNYDQAGDQSAFTVDFTNKGDLQRGLKTSFGDF